MKISVVGTGYVGLVAGVCFADAGHHAICVDNNQDKIARLKKGEVPIYEPGLEDIMEPAVRAGRLEFTTDLKSAVERTDVIFIAVGTPEMADGNADMSVTFAVVEAIASHATSEKCVVLKSTVPIGTAHRVANVFRERSRVPMHVVSNPEFLKEGAAIDDFLRPDRIVIGCSSEKAKETMSKLYAPFVKNGHPIYFMDNVSAEMTKYAANAFLSVKISYINELARLADTLGADINMVRQGFTSDKRINPAFFYPGAGFGGSCFPKDIRALVTTAKANGLNMKLVEAADQVNDLQKHYLFELAQKTLGNLSGKTIAMWGLSFKPRTDDVREAPALYLIEDFVKAGARVKAFDPIASENAKKACAVSFDVAPSAYEALDKADALCLVTEWNEFRSPDFAEMKRRMKTPVILDGRNVFDPATMKGEGFTYHCIGRQAVFTRGSTAQ